MKAPKSLTFIGFMLFTSLTMQVQAVNPVEYFLKLFTPVGQNHDAERGTSKSAADANSTAPAANNFGGLGGGL